MKCALVTGGSRGIGRATCLKLSEMGYYVLVNFKSNLQEAGKTLDLLKERNGEGALLPFDVSDPGAVRQSLGDWANANPDKYIEVLVNNAGIKEDALLFYMTDEQWKSVMQSNLDSFFYVTKFVLGDMIYRRYGRIVNIVSLSGQKGQPGQTNYSAAKAGVIGATKSLAQEIGRHGITVNAVSPGLISTDMTADMEEDQWKKIIPVRRFGLPEEVAHAVGFLASREAAYITGETLSINGGLYT